MLKLFYLIRLKHTMKYFRLIVKKKCVRRKLFFWSIIIIIKVWTKTKKRWLIKKIVQCAIVCYNHVVKIFELINYIYDNSIIYDIVIFMLLFFFAFDFNYLDSLFFQNWYYDCLIQFNDFYTQNIYLLILRLSIVVYFERFHVCNNILISTKLR